MKFLDRNLFGFREQFAYRSHGGLFLEGRLEEKPRTGGKCRPVENAKVKQLSVDDKLYPNYPLKCLKRVIMT